MFLFSSSSQGGDGKKQESENKTLAAGEIRRKGSRRAKQKQMRDKRTKIRRRGEGKGRGR